MRAFPITLLVALSAFITFSCENNQSQNETVNVDSLSQQSTVADTATARTFQLDTANSSISWTGQKVSGKHNGKIKFKDGQLTAKGGILTDGKMVIDMTSISNEDLTDSESNQKIIGHLKSDDFFAVNKYPTATFDVKRIDPGTDDMQIVVGDLTIKDKTEEISIPAKINVKDKTVTASGKTSIDRTKWDIRYGSGKFFEGLGDKMIYDEIELEYDLKATE